MGWWWGVTYSTDPLDDMHREAMQAIERIRKTVDIARQIVAEWEPKPLPKSERN